MSKELDKLQDWLIEKSEILNDNHWDKIMKAEQDLAQIDNKKRRRNLQNIALKARNDIKKFISQLDNLPMPSSEINLKTHEYLNNWDKSFYFMAKYADTRTVKDFGSATRSYKMVDQNFQEILESFGIGNLPQTQQTQTTTPATGHHVIREKEIIREKQVIIKIRCSYCKKTYNEELDCCPHCGGTR